MATSKTHARRPFRRFPQFPIRYLDLLRPGIWPGEVWTSPQRTVAGAQSSVRNSGGPQTQRQQQQYFLNALWPDT